MDNGPDPIGGEGLVVVNLDAGRVVEAARVDVGIGAVEVGAVEADWASDEGVVAAVGLLASGNVEVPGGSDDGGGPGNVAVIDSASEEARASTGSVPTPTMPNRPMTIHATYGRRGCCVAANIDFLFLMGTGEYDIVS